MDVDRIARALVPRSRRAAVRTLAAGGLAAVVAPTRAPSQTAARKKNDPWRRKNWCVDRSHTCGPAGENKRCLVKAFGGNVCAESLFQAQTCAECGPPTCVDCLCVLAAGGGDRCNNGADGYDFICVRA